MSIRFLALLSKNVPSTFAIGGGDGVGQGLGPGRI
jgi:hypothetical protein